MTQENSQGLDWLLPRSHFLPVEISTKYHPIYLHKQDHTEVVEHLVEVSTLDYLKEQELFQWRFSTQLPIPRVFHGKLLHEKRDSATISIFVESFSQNLEEFSNLRIADTLYILRTCLLTLEKLCQKFGYFSVSPAMISISPQNQCKVWPNEQFQQNGVQIPCESEDSMIKQLFSIVRQRTEATHHESVLFSKMQREECSFSNAQKLISKYAYQEAVVIPEKVVGTSNESQVLVGNVFQDQWNWNQTGNIKMYRSQFQNPQLKQTLTSPYSPATEGEAESGFKEQGFNFINSVKKVQSQNANDYDLIAQSSNNLLSVPKNRPLMKRSSNDQTVNSTQVSAFDLPQEKQISEHRLRVKKFQTLNMQHHPSLKTDNFDETKGDKCPSFLTENRKRSPSNGQIAQQAEKSAVSSSCWSETDAIEKDLAENCLAKNKWRVSLVNLFGDDVNLRSSIHIEDKKDKHYDIKVQELQKLKLNRFSGSQQIYESIVQNDALRDHIEHL